MKKNDLLPNGPHRPRQVTEPANALPTLPGGSSTNLQMPPMMQKKKKRTK